MPARTAPTSPLHLPSYVYWPWSFNSQMAARGFRQHRASWWRCLTVDLTPTGWRAEWEVMFPVRGKGWAKRLNVYHSSRIGHDPMLSFGEQADAGRMMDPHSTFFVSRDGTITEAAHSNGRDA